FANFYERLSAAPVTQKAARDYLRVLLSGASDEIPDKQGRITIPANLREYAGLERDLAVIGAGTRVEVWDKAAWEQYLGDQEEAFADTASQILPELAF
ncbi:MAG: cell division/cell wall cluster transcriptional repressor MraZ, partial [Promicromonosporaceae bacterium]|nr:cell division/cell wall cluster transcriptional repressor MraZ [Promicromonosporaceae bacterium]